MRAKKFTRFTEAISAGRFKDILGTGAIAVAVVCIVAGVMLIAAWQPSSSAANTSQKPAAVVPTAKKTTAATPAKTAQTPAKAAASNSAAPAVVPAKTAPEATVAKASAPEVTTATITGCLERHDQGFRLKDTSGTAAPKSRSWKSGFITKRSASIDVVDATNRLQLRNYVGQRVQLTGKLQEREMQVRSLLRVASSCN